MSLKEAWRFGDLGQWVIVYHSRQVQVWAAIGALEIIFLKRHRFSKWNSPCYPEMVKPLHDSYRQVGEHADSSVSLILGVWSQSLCCVGVCFEESSPPCPHTAP